jgi:digeranylgeranylglycerophospholipid reductase
MDGDLVKRAQAVGVQYYPATAVTEIKRNSNLLYSLSTTAGECTALSVILADGVESKLARSLGWDTHLALEDISTCAFCRIRHDAIHDDAVVFHVGSEVAPGGYLWVFPRGNGEANCGLGILGSMSAPNKSREYLQKFIEKNYPGAVISHEHCGGVPVGKWTSPLARAGVLLVGDAARQVSALTGAGIAYGCIAGRMAGEAAAAAIENGVLNEKKLCVYEKKWAKSFGRQQLRTYALKQALMLKNNDTFFNSVASSLARQDPRNLNYFSVFARTFARHPLLLIKVFLLFR